MEVKRKDIVILPVWLEGELIHRCDIGFIGN